MSAGPVRNSGTYPWMLKFLTGQMVALWLSPLGRRSVDCRHRRENIADQIPNYQIPKLQNQKGLRTRNVTINRCAVIHKPTRRPTRMPIIEPACPPVVPPPIPIPTALQDCLFWVEFYPGDYWLKLEFLGHLPSFPYPELISSQ